MKYKNGILFIVVVLAIALGLNASAVEMSGTVENAANGALETEDAVLENATFGTLTDLDAAGHCPDFVKATGTNGVVGYVRAKDLPQPAANPQAAQEYMATLTPDSHQEIPLYDSDGVTVIGEFRVFTGYNG